jgi:hypothetical protein
VKESFYKPSTEALDTRWSQWLERWRARITAQGDPDATAAAMKRANPAMTWREWLIAPAYEQAAEGGTRLIQELQAVFRHHYDESSAELAARYDRLKPREFFNAGGLRTTAVRRQRKGRIPHLPFLRGRITVIPDGGRAVMDAVNALCTA